MKRLVIYDMDKTITRQATYSAFLIHMARAQALQRLALAPLSAAYGLAYMARMMSRSRLKELNQQLFLGYRADKTGMQRAIGDFADRVIRENVHDAAKKQIAADKEDGCTIMMATASYTLYAQAIGQRLGCDVILGTELQQDSKGKILAAIEGENCYGTAKKARITRWMAANGGADQWQIVRCYSDHVSDAPMLELAEEPIAVNPHTPLRELAKRRGWRTEQWY